MWGLIGLVATVLKWMFTGRFSAQARLHRKQRDEAVQHARTAVEADRLRETYRRIEAAPPPTEDPAENINDRMDRLRRRKST